MTFGATSIEPDTAILMAAAAILSAFIIAGIAHTILERRRHKREALADLQMKAVSYIDYPHE